MSYTDSFQPITYGSYFVKKGVTLHLGVMRDPYGMRDAEMTKVTVVTS